MQFPCRKKINFSKATLCACKAYLTPHESPCKATLSFLRRRIKMKRLTLGNFFGLMLLLGAASGAGFAISEKMGWIRQSEIARYTVICMAMGLLIGSPYSLLWWKKADEAVKEAHKWAWSWGGGIGLIVAMIIVCVNYYFNLGLAENISDPFGTGALPFEAGFFFALYPAVIGYGLAWAVWWLRHR
jgi:hypothetical protein